MVLSRSCEKSGYQGRALKAFKYQTLFAGIPVLTGTGCHPRLYYPYVLYDTCNTLCLCGQYCPGTYSAPPLATYCQEVPTHTSSLFSIQSDYCLVY